MKEPYIKNAIKNIKEACDTSLAKHYPINIPKDIIARYQQELDYLSKSDYVEDFELFRLLSDESKKCADRFSMRGTVMGSFLYFLLGNNCFNPLPVHYYCPHCGYYEPLNTHSFGIDLPDKKCPCCHKTLSADGYNLHSESVWGVDGRNRLSFEYLVSKSFLPFAKRVLDSFYPENEIVLWKTYETNYTALNSASFETTTWLHGYAVLPTGKTTSDFPCFLSSTEDGIPCIIGSSAELRENTIKPIHMDTNRNSNYLIRLQRATGIYANELSNLELKNTNWYSVYHTTLLDCITSNLFHEIRPTSFHEMISLYASAHNTFSWSKNGATDLHDYHDMISSASFEKYPCYTRDDFMDYLLDDGIDRISAYEITKEISKGHANSEKTNNNSSLSKDLLHVAQNYVYVFPRAHCIESVLQYASLAYYFKADNHTFFKILQER